MVRNLKSKKNFYPWRDCMIKNSSCCSNCFDNKYIKKYITENSKEIGICPYCKSNSVPLISLRTMADYMRDCIDKAYVHCDDGSGAMYISEDKEYIGPDGEEASIYSIREILSEEEGAVSDSVMDTALVDDLFENIYSYRDVQKGAVDPYEGADIEQWVIRNDLYGYEQIGIFHAWEDFKHIIMHYNRFFDFNDGNIRVNYLERINPYICVYDKLIPRGTKFYRVRKEDESIQNIYAIEPYSQLGPPPAELAQTNRMSPAGIPYLYVATDIETAVKECRMGINDVVIAAEFMLKDDLNILDLSENRLFTPRSIFDPDYDHDDRWLNGFMKGFVSEISKPVSNDDKDRSYDYAATQVLAEYYRNLGYDGICYKSSVGRGNSYVFFMGPDPQYSKNAYPYPFNSQYYHEELPILPVFTEFFEIISVSKIIIEGTSKEIEKNMF